MESAAEEIREGHKKSGSKRPIDSDQLERARDRAWHLCVLEREPKWKRKKRDPGEVMWNLKQLASVRLKD